jgi:hypothetical protein
MLYSWRRLWTWCYVMMHDLGNIYTGHLYIFVLGSTRAWGRAFLQALHLELGLALELDGSQI